MSARLREVIKAIRCCRDDNCIHCPLQKEICDELWVDMESLPAELVDMIEEELEEHNESGRSKMTIKGT